jgi:hypothetical protein
VCEGNSNSLGMKGEVAEMCACLGGSRRQPQRAKRQITIRVESDGEAYVDCAERENNSNILGIYDVTLTGVS